MANSRDKRNYGCGRRLIDHKTRTNVSAQVARANGRGSKSEEMNCSGLRHLAEYLREVHNVNYLEAMTPDMAKGWAQDLRQQLAEEELSRSATSSYVAAYNQTMRYFARPELVLDAAKEMLSRGPKYSNVNRANNLGLRDALRSWALSNAASSQGLEKLLYEGLYHTAWLQESAGLRLRESWLTKLSGKDISEGVLPLCRSDGTKNGRARLATILDQGAVESTRNWREANRDVLNRSSQAPGSLTWRQVRRWVYNQIDKFRSETGVEYHAHGNRSSYAQTRFESLWQERAGANIQCPVKAQLFGSEWIGYAVENTGLSLQDTYRMDKDIRLIVSADLGHGRADVVSAYVGR